MRDLGKLDSIIELARNVYSSTEQYRQATTVMSNTLSLKSVLYQVNNGIVEYIFLVCCAYTYES